MVAIHPPRRFAMAAFAFVATVTVVSSAEAQTSGLITACVGNLTGLTRLVADSEACRAWETRIQWKKQGEPGPMGPAGARGATGAAGPAGPTGPAGATGATGPAGPLGATGPAGPAGPAGAHGAVGPQGPQGPAGADGAPGPIGATGAIGPRGLPGADGAPATVRVATRLECVDGGIVVTSGDGRTSLPVCNGAEGPQGPAGPAGPQGPAGPAGPPGPTGPASGTPAAPPPVPYSGTFAVSIDGGPAFRLTAFGGCFDKVLGVEYEDCYFATRLPAASLFAWVNETVNEPRRHDLEVSQLDVQNTVLATISVHDAFLREFAISDLDATGSEIVTFTFVAVPEQLTMSTGGGSLSTGVAKQLVQDNFRIAIDQVDGRGFAGLHGLRLSVPKVPQSIGGGPRHRYGPGTPQFDPVTFLASTSNFDTAADLDEWARDASLGAATSRSGEVELLNAPLTATEARISLVGVFPLTFPPFQTATNRRTFTAQITRFTVQ